MNNRIIKYYLLAIIISTTGSAIAYAQQHQHGEQHNNFRSPYVEQLDSLSSSDVANLLNGKGAGYARTAELNGYPGLRHVLDLSSQLNLSSQKTAIQAAFEQMQSQAKAIGKTIVSKKRAEMLLCKQLIPRPPFGQELGESFA